MNVISVSTDNDGNNGNGNAVANSLPNDHQSQPTPSEMESVNPDTRDDNPAPNHTNVIYLFFPRIVAKLMYFVVCNSQIPSTIGGTPNSTLDATELNTSGVDAGTKSETTDVVRMCHFFFEITFVNTSLKHFICPTIKLILYFLPNPSGTECHN